MNKKEIVDIIFRLILCFFIVIFILLLLLSIYSILDVFKTKDDNWISFWGSILGGGLTLVGVWWTIIDQEKKRNQELELQYQPILSANITKYRQINRLCNELHLLFNHVGFDDNNLEPAPFMLEFKNIGRGEIRNFNIHIDSKDIIISPFNDSNQLDLSNSSILADGFFDFFPINGSKYLLVLLPKQKVLYNQLHPIRIGITLNILVNGFITEVGYEYLLTFYININLNGSEKRLTADSITLDYVGNKVNHKSTKSVG